MKCIRISFDSKFFSDNKTNKYWFGEKLFLFVEQFTGERNYFLVTPGDTIKHGNILMY